MVVVSQTLAAEIVSKEPCKGVDLRGKSYLKGSPLGRGARLATAASFLSSAIWADRKETTVSAPSSVRSALVLAISAKAQLDCREAGNHQVESHQYTVKCL